MSNSSSQEGIKLHDLCRRINVDYDEARYVLAKGILPKAVAKSEPGRGNHRLFSPSQAFYLAVCLKLKAAGINSTLAAEICEMSRQIQNLAKKSGWDLRFVPFGDEIDTEQRWLLDVGDARYVRLVTDAFPSSKGMHVFPWTDIYTHQKSPEAQPAIIFRVDFSLIAKQVRGDFVD
jgi:hypothetical protein